MAFDSLWACRECQATVAASAIGVPPDLDECPTCGEPVDHWIEVAV